ncbi:Intersectin-1 [Fasciola gigantica]|uniref:Intersectin-1 n=1 Tax=Fasciola gigantica TaxID=46835 RepID=A0A504YDZ2_FASGI|nr:Intersectin-1 [Fasciola gigantica]
MSPISRPKYRLLFNQHDRTKRGFITGVEARGIFIKSGLSQQILAHIWNLADIDKDGPIFLAGGGLRGGDAEDFFLI